MNQPPDYYRVLGVGMDASGNEVRAAYVRLMKRQFDTIATSGGTLPPDRIRLMQEAYACLRDPARRADHDRWRLQQDQDHAAAVRRRQRRLRSYDKRHHLAASPRPASYHWRSAVILAGMGCAVLGLVGWLCA